FQQYRRQKLDTKDPELAQALEERAGLMRQLAERRYYLATREDRSGPDDARAAVIREEIRGLRVSLGVIDARVAARTRVTVRPAPPPFDAELRKFDRGVAGIEYWIGAARSYAWVVNGSKVTWVRLADGAAITDAARRFHASLSSFASTPRAERLAAAVTLNG